MVDNITGKSILLICDNFYNYDIEIKNELLKLGAKDVYLKRAKFYSGSFRDKFNWRASSSYLKNFIYKERTQWTKNFIEEIKGKHFDIMLCVENLSFKKWFIDYLRKENPHIKIFLFLWDTFKTQQPRYFDYLPKFDYVFSFDRDDCKNYNLMYSPDFYIDYPSCPLNIRYDISFVGTMNDSSTFFRGELLSKINTFCIENKLKTYFYLKYVEPIYNSNRFKDCIKTILNRKYEKEIAKHKFSGFLYKSPIPLDSVNSIFNASKVILDLNHQNRQGMTINCITALAKGKKLITTNKRIKEESFYNPNNILIIDEKDPILNMDFFVTPTIPLNMENLRLDNWLKNILNRK